MTYYRSNITGSILTEGSIRVLNDIYGNSAVCEAIDSGSIEVVTDPDIIECIKYGRGSAAVFRYRELHPDVSIQDAFDAVKKIRKDMRWIRKTGK